MTTAPPTDNPNLPSFQEADYGAIAPDLALVLDCWNDLKGRKELYLPQEEAEPRKAYANRLERTRFDNRFEPAIRGHAGLLSQFDLTEATPPTLQTAAENIDLQGNDATTFWQQADEWCLRDGGVGVLVEYPTADPGIQSKGDLLASGRRPYLVLCDRRNILNWRTETVNGVVVLQRVTIREYRQVADGAFGSKLATRYRVLQPGYWSIYRIEQDQGSNWQAILEEEGETGLDTIPLIWYAPTGATEWFVGKPPFINLAGLNIEHFQKRSSLNEVMHKCNLPVPVRRGLVKTIQDLAKVPRLIIGPNSVVDVPESGDFTFAEPTGNAIAATQADITKLEAAMDRVSLAFLNGGEGQKTATEVILDTAQTQCTLKGMARRKENAAWKVAALWAAYTGEAQPEHGAGLAVNESILKPPANPQDVQLILDNMGVKFSNKLGLEMLRDRNWLPPEFDLQAELAQLEASDRQQAEEILSEAIPNGQTPNPSGSAPPPRTVV